MNENRRTVLRSGAVLLPGVLAGCTGSGGTESVPRPDTTGHTVDSLPTPTLGPEDADVTVSVYEDYACGHCKRYVLDTFPSLREEYVADGIVEYEHHDFPIPVDERWSWAIASAARAVQDAMGDEAFFDFATTIYEYADEYSLDVVESVASDVGADPRRVRSAAEAVTYGPVLVADRRRGIEAGVQGTPTIFVNGVPTDGYDWETVSTAIEAARP